MIVKIVVPDSIYANVYFARGEQGPQGVTGNTGPQGPSGIVNVVSPITNSGTTTAANIGLNQALIQIAPAQVTGTAVVTADSRLSDQRVPTSGSVTDAKIVAGGLSTSAITGTAVITTDARLSDSRTPTAHAATHGSAGSDPVTLAQSQITNLVSDLTAKAPKDSPVFTTKVTLPLTSGTFLGTNSLGEIYKVGGAPGLGYIPYTASVGGGIAWLDSGLLARDDQANTFTVGGHVINNNAVGTIPLVLRGVASQTSNMLEIQDETSGTYASISKFGTTRLGGAVMTGGRLMVQAGGALVGLQVRDGGSGANIAEFQSSAGSILSRFSSSGQFVSDQQTYIGSGATSISNARLNVATGSASVIGAVIRGAASQSADALQLQDSGGNAYLNMSVFGGISTNLSGAYPGRLSVGTGTASTIGVVVRGAASQSADYLQIQNSAGTVQVKVDSGGYAFSIGWILNNGVGSFENAFGGALLAMQKTTSTVTNPGANRARIFVKDGTNAGTLKLVVRAGAAGAETTILDNIPQ